MKKFSICFPLLALILIFCGCSKKENPVDSNQVNPGNLSLSKISFSDIEWEDFINNPVFTRAQNPSMPYDVRQCQVLFEGGIYKMWYTTQYIAGVSNIWYAESPDGINWHSVGSGPVLDIGAPGSWDSYAITLSGIVKDGAEYKMYYIGQHEYYLVADWSIGLAVSSDGIHWTKHGQPVLHSDNNYYYIAASDVIKKNGIYFMYFGYRGHSLNQSRIGLAKSADGINWVFCQNPILTGTNSWEGGGVGWPTVFYENGKFTMMYENESQSDVKYLQTSFGIASSLNGANFTKEANPFFSNTNTVNNWLRIAYPFFRKLDNQYKIYYSGEYYSDEQDDNITNISLIKPKESAFANAAVHLQR